MSGIRNPFEDCYISEDADSILSLRVEKQLKFMSAAKTKRDKIHNKKLNPDFILLYIPY